MILSSFLSVGGVVGCVSNHNKALKNRNMVRFNADVIKRKDIVKLKKNTGF